VLLRWMHLRKLVPLADLFEQLGGTGTKNQVASTNSKAAPTSGRVAPATNTVAPTSSRVAPASGKLAPTSNDVARTTGSTAPTSGSTAPTSDSTAPTSDPLAPTSNKIAPLKDALLAEIRSGKAFFYNTVVAQAQKIEVVDDRVTFTFLPAHRALREQFEQSRPWLEAAAERLTGRKIAVAAVQAAAQSGEAAEPEQKNAAPAAAPKRDLKAEALSSTGVQALLDVFPAEIRDVEEM